MAIFPVLYNICLLLIYFIHSSLCLLILYPYLTPPHSDLLSVLHIHTMRLKGDKQIVGLVACQFLFHTADSVNLLQYCSYYKKFTSPVFSL